jgi:hypothetical protein
MYDSRHEIEARRVETRSGSIHEGAEGGRQRSLGKASFDGLSADGNTAIMGGYSDNDATGAVLVLQR